MSEDTCQCIVMVGIIIGICFYFQLETNKNNKPRYSGTTPTNCRALIIENVNGARYGTYTYEQALDSIDRNCGITGYLWDD